MLAGKEEVETDFVGELCFANHVAKPLAGWQVLRRDRTLSSQGLSVRWAHMGSKRWVALLLHVAEDGEFHWVYLLGVSS